MARVALCSFAGLPKRAVLGVEFAEGLGEGGVGGEGGLERLVLLDGGAGSEDDGGFEEEAGLEHGAVFGDARADERVGVGEVLERLARAEEADATGGEVERALAALDRAHHLTEVQVEAQLTLRRLVGIPGRVGGGARGGRAGRASAVDGATTEGGAEARGAQARGGGGRGVHDRRGAASAKTVAQRGGGRGRTQEACGAELWEGPSDPTEVLPH